MFKWAMMMLALGAVAGCMGAMGVGTIALAKLLLALCLTSGVSILIAWPFLRKAGPHEIAEKPTLAESKKDPPRVAPTLT